RYIRRSCHRLLIAPRLSEIYTLSLHDGLPIFGSAQQLPEPSTREAHRPPHYSLGALHGDRAPPGHACVRHQSSASLHRPVRRRQDRKSTRLNSSHGSISYAVFCLKKKKITTII